MRRTSTRPTRRMRQARGVVYLFVLCTSLLVVAIGVSAITLGRIELRQTRGERDAAVARTLARSAIEVGLAKIKSDENWRTTLGVGVWVPSTAMGGGRMRLEALSIDTTTPSNDAVTLLGTGGVGDAVQMLQVVVRRGAVIERSTWKRVVN